MTAFGKVDIEYATHEASVNNPDTYAVLQLLPKPLMHIFAIWQYLPAMGHSGGISSAAAFLSFFLVRFGQCLFIRHALCHKPMLH